MTRTLSIAALLTLWLPSAVGAADGRALFAANGCNACHKANEDSVGPSLAKISGTYAGDKVGLVAFLGGKGAPRVEPEELAIMKPTLKKTGVLTDEERGALADFILEHK